MSGEDESPFCCAGCQTVHRLLRGEHLERYYELRGAVGVPVVLSPERRDRKWLESMSGSRLELDVQGIHCSACVWLLEELFRRQPAGVSLLVNPSLGTMLLSVQRAFELEPFVRAVEGFGYRVGPKRKDAGGSASGELLTRLGVCAALSMNAMIFAVAMYAGLSEGPLARLFEALELALGTGVLLVGGSVFLRAAWQAVRLRALHLDLPIALGIVLAYAGSVAAFVSHRPAYFDTLGVFVTLMLLGRFLQQRVLEQNRRQLLGDGGSPSLLTRRSERGTVRIVPCGDLAIGDELVIAPGDLVPVDARVLAGAASCSLDWINGESRPRGYEAGDVVPAGAFNAGEAALRLRAETDFEHSAVTDILRTPARAPGMRGVESSFLRRLAPLYVVGVLALSATAFFVWALATHDLGRAMSVTTAMLVVTCPCAFGIATPLAYDLVQAGLRRRGLYVRSADFLDKAPRIRKVVFDKTGTITDGTLEVANPEVLDGVSIADQSVLLAMVQGSSHPKSEAIRRALHVVAADGVTAKEIAGYGLEAGAFRLGPGGVFSRGGEPLARFEIRERPRSDAKAEVSALEARGYEVWMLSGDDPSRVREVALACGIDESRAIGSATAKEKADWLRAHDDHDTLMIGDGINDLEAVAVAFCSGTPAVDRPFVASRADFYFLSAGLGPIRAALDASRVVGRVVKRNFVVATAYNVVAVSLVFAGLMSPLLAAVLMPVSSVSTILATTLSLSQRSRAWKS